tara:strand:- start:2943 stop:3674 length:732 start_codon:yes stop_codon:yes gene_type:complete
MGIKLPREKKRNFLLSVIYRLQKIIPVSDKKKLKFFLDLEWIFERLAHEYSFKNYNEVEHPLRVHTKEFIFKYLKEDYTVLDLGCKYGEITNAIAEKAKTAVGIDFDVDAINKAKKNYSKPNLSFEVGEALSYISSSAIKFDVLILSHILEHLDNPLQFLKEHVSHFKLVYIELPDFDKSLLNHYRKQFNNDLIYSDNDHISEFDRDELEKLIQNSGLQILESMHIFGVHKYWCQAQSIEKIN